jgi:hypothetical protein
MFKLKKVNFIQNILEDEELDPTFYFYNGCYMGECTGALGKE